MDVGILAGRKIVVAEDNPVNRSFAKHLLTAAGAEVWEAEDGNQAVALTQAHAPDLILMDCRMPECDGFEATQRIRAWEPPGKHRIPIVAVTAHAMKEDQRRCRDAGMDDYISKPFKKKALLEKLALLLQSGLENG